LAPARIERFPVLVQQSCRAESFWVFIGKEKKGAKFTHLGKFVARGHV